MSLFHSIFGRKHRAHRKRKREPTRERSLNQFRVRRTPPQNASYPSAALGEVKKYHRIPINHYTNGIKGSEVHKFIPEDAFKFVRSQDEICAERRGRREEILRKTAGRGLKVKYAKWNVESYFQCKKG